MTNIRIVLLYKFVLISLVLLPQIPALSQSENPQKSMRDKADIAFDSLNACIIKAEDDTTKINLLNQIAWNYAPISFTLSMRYADSALTLSRQISWRKGEGYALKNMGEALRFNGQFDIALENFNHALSLFTETHNDIAKASILSNIGTIHYLLSDLSKAYEFYLLSNEIYINIGYIKGILGNYSVIGNIFYEFEQYEKAKENYQKAAKLAQEINDYYIYAIQEGNLGLVNIHQKKFKQAVNKLKLSLDELKKVQDYYNYSIMAGNLGLAYYELGDFQKAEEMYNESVVYSKENNDYHGVAIQYGNIGSLYLKMYQDNKKAELERNRTDLLKNAEKYLLLSIEIFNSLESNINHAYYYKKLSELYKEKQEYETALKYEEIANQLDTLSSFENGRRITELATEKTIIRKNKEIDDLSVGYAQEKFSSKVLLLIEIVLVISIIILFYFYSKRRMMNIKLQDYFNRMKEIEKSLLHDILKINGRGQDKSNK